MSQRVNLLISNLLYVTQNDAQIARVGANTIVTQHPERLFPRQTSVDLAVLEKPFATVTQMEYWCSHTANREFTTSIATARARVDTLVQPVFEGKNGDADPGE
jgi:hypothetical protein